jgi:hypothetical protein
MSGVLTIIPCSLVVVYLSRTTGNYGDEWLELLEMNLDEKNVVVYLSRTTGNYGDEWLELLEMNLDEMKVVAFIKTNIAGI